jgi:hypothetical protein
MNEGFKNMLSKKFPNMDIEKVNTIIDEEVSKISKGPSIKIGEERVPIGELVPEVPSLPVNSDLNKAIIFNVLDRYMNSK